MTIETCAQMQTRLDGYIAARDKIAIGKQTVGVHTGSMSLQYSPADMKRLDLLIREVRLLMQSRRCAGCRRGSMFNITPSG